MFAMRSVYSKDISLTWTSFLMKVVGVWIATDRVEQRHRRFAIIYTISAIFIAMCIAIRDIYFSWGNFSDCVYISCNMLYLTVALFKIAALYAHRMEFFDLIRFTEKNFWHSNYDYRENLLLADCKKVCVVFVILISFCTQGTCAGYMMTPLIGNIGKNQSERMLPFNLWVDFPTGLSPYFEVIFTIQILCVYHVGVCCICIDNILYVLNLHVASQFRILQHRLTNLAHIIKNQRDGRSSHKQLSSYRDLYIKLQSCVERHQMLTEYCKKLEDIFTLIVLGQVIFLTLLICLVGYQLFLIQTPTSRQIALILNWAASLLQLFIFTYSCDGLIQQSLDVSATVYSIPWTNLPMDKIGQPIRKSVLIIVTRSNKSCYLTASGFFPISLQTYTTILSTAMSYFTLLRKSAENLQA